MSSDRPLQLLASHPPPGPGRILLVEDEVLIQMLAAEDLEKLGFQVEIAASAASAKSKLQSLNGAVDAALVDVGLPDMKGDDLVAEMLVSIPNFA